jgi:hypothetical protein
MDRRAADGQSHRLVELLNGKKQWTPFVGVHCFYEGAKPIHHSTFPLMVQLLENGIQP